MEKTFVINGAAHEGFGKASARLFLERGHRVIGLYEEQDKLSADAMVEKYSRERLSMIQMDLCDVQSARQAVGQISGKINGFINACFYYDMDDVNNYDVDLAEKIFVANYHIPFFLSVELKKYMKAESSIVIVTSTEAARGSFGGISYAASKAAVHNMIMSLACNWGKKDKIRVNAVAAGWIGGEMDTDGPFKMSIDITPLGRLGKAEDVAEAVYFLASEKAGFINGQVLNVDGGYLCVDDIAKYEYEESQKQRVE